MGPPMASKGSTEANYSKQRGPNPQTDYKRHFNRTKERFDLVNAVRGVDCRMLCGILLTRTSLLPVSGSGSSEKGARQGKCKAGKVTRRARVSALRRYQTTQL